MAKLKSWLVLLLLFSLIIALWGAFWWFIVRTPSLAGWGERGQFGDMFGALNALFSGLALGGVIYALYLQMQELALQREEMAQSREELRRTADAQSEQVHLLSRQVLAMEKSIRDDAERRSREATPQFKFTGAPETGGVRQIGLENHSSQIAYMEAEPLGDFSVRLDPRDLLGTRQIMTAIVQRGSTPLPELIRFRLTYTDVFGARRTVTVETDASKRTARTLTEE